MECWCVSKMKSWLLMMMMIGSVMVCGIEGGCIEEEREALLQIKSSLIHSYDALDVESILPSWVDDGGECCDWERVNCNTTTGHVTNLSLRNVVPKMVDDEVMGCIMSSTWALNVSLFLHFKELTNLNLSSNCLDDGIVNTGLGRLSSLKKLEVLDLSYNSITNEAFPSLGALASLRVLILGDNNLEGYFPALALENLEILDLSDNYRMEGFEQVSLLKKLKFLVLGFNKFNESFITSLSALPMLKALELSSNDLSGWSFPGEELFHLVNLEELDLSFNDFSDTPSIQECTGLSRLKKLKGIYLGGNKFNKSIISCLSVLPSLKTLDLSSSRLSEGSFSIQDLSYLPRELEELFLSDNGFNGTLPMGALASLFHHLQVLDLSGNRFVGSIPSTIQELSSLRAVSFANNELNGSLPDGFCELNNLHELDLSHNMFVGSLPQCFNRLSSLKLLDISSNQFTGRLMPSLIANLTSLKYADFSNNKFGGSFLLSSFSNLTNLEVVRFVSKNDKFEVETESPIGWIPLFQLKVLVLSNCNINRPKGSVIPRFLLHQRMLQIIDLSDNSLVGPFPNWLIDNNTMLSALVLRNNSFSGIICMPLHMNANIRWLDVSENHMNGLDLDDIHKFLPYITYLNLSSNYLDDVIPSSIRDLSWLRKLDLSDNELSGEVPEGLLSNLSTISILKLSNNRLHGQVLSGNLSLGYIEMLYLDNNCFTGKIGNLTNLVNLNELIVSNNGFEGRFPCGTTSFSFLDISQNSFSGPIPTCLNFQYMRHLHFGSNRFTGSIPNAFRNLTDVLTLDIGNNSLSGKIPGFLGNLSELRILILRKNNFIGSIPMQLCYLPSVSLMDLSSNSLSGSIPSCLQNITTPVYPAFIRSYGESYNLFPHYYYDIVLPRTYDTIPYDAAMIGTQDEVQFTTKALSLAYKGHLLDLMVGLDLSCNRLTGEIPEELGLLNQIHSLNLSHNQLYGPIPVNFSNLANIESLDLSSNNLIGGVPSQLIKLNSLAFFNVSYNNLSGRLPVMKAQFSTFTRESYEGNPLLCGPPLEKKCTIVNNPSTKEGSDKWCDIDMVSFYGSSGATLVVFLLGFVAVLYINPYWRRRWLDLVEEYMYTCYYFFDDSVRKLRMLFRKYIGPPC